MILVVTTILLDNIIPRVKFKKIYLPNLVLKYLLYTFVLLFLYLSIVFALNYDISFRHQNRLSESGIIKIIPHLRFVGMFFIFIHFSHFIKNREIYKNQRGLIFLVTLSLLLTTTSSLGVPLIFIGLFLSLVPVYISHKVFVNHVNFFKFIIIIFLLLVLFILVIYMGYANKWGHEEIIKIFSNFEFYSMLFEKIFTRLSTSYASVNAAISQFIFLDINYQFEIFYSSFKDFLSKLTYIFGLSEGLGGGISSVSRENFLILFTGHQYLPRSGTSPGIVASILFVPFFPMGLILLSFYSVVVIRVFNHYNPYYLNINFLGKLTFVYFLVPLIESPLSSINLFIPVSIYLILLLLSILIKSKNSYK